MAIERMTPAVPTEEAPVRHASPAGRVGWAIFDWANQPFFTLITTFIFAPYFTGVVVGDPVRGQALWGYTQSIAGVILAVGSPILGAIADAGGRKKPFIAAFQALTVLGCVLLWWAQPDGTGLGLALVALVIGTIGAEFSIVFNNALLPGLVPPHRIGRLSGFGWGLGYAGGLLALVVVLLLSRPELFGIAVPEGQDLLGFDRARYVLERAIGPASALWLMLFVLPMFLFTPDTPHTGRTRTEAAVHGLRQLGGTLRNVLRYRNAARYLLAYMIYNDGLAAVIAFGGIYAAGTFGWSTTELGIFGIAVTVLGMIGAFVGGWLDDLLGSKRTISLAIAGTTLAAIGFLSVGPGTILFVIDVAPAAPDAGPFAAPAEQAFMGFALLLGLCMGPMQAASRTMIGRLAPPGMTGEFYGLFALSGRATTFLAPFLIAVVTQASGAQRPGILVVLVFLVVGFVLLQGVREERLRR